MLGSGFRFLIRNDREFETGSLFIHILSPALKSAIAQAASPF
jgi:hypothetical protein